MNILSNLVKRFMSARLIQSNLSTKAILGTPKKWQLIIGGCSVEVFQSKLVSNLAWAGLSLANVDRWPLFRGGH